MNCCNKNCNQGRNCPARETDISMRDRVLGVLVAFAIGAGLALALVEWWT